MNTKKALIITLLLANAQFLSAVIDENTKFYLEYAKKIGQKTVSRKAGITRDALNQSKKLKYFVERVGTDKKYYNKNTKTMTVPLQRWFNTSDLYSKNIRDIKQWDIQKFAKLSEITDVSKLSKKLKDLSKEQFSLLSMFAKLVENEKIVNAIKTMREKRTFFLEYKGTKVPITRSAFNRSKASFAEAFARDPDVTRPPLVGATVATRGGSSGSVISIVPASIAALAVAIIVVAFASSNPGTSATLRIPPST